MLIKWIKFVVAQSQLSRASVAAQLCSVVPRANPVKFYEVVMDSKTLEVLEYAKIIQQLTELSFSELGKKLVAELSPGTDLEEIAVWQTETADGVQVILQKTTPPIYGVHDLTPYLQRSRTGAAMTCRQLLLVDSFLRAVERVRGFAISDIKLQDNSYNCLMKALQPIHSLQQRLSKAIISEDEVADAASPALAQIRQQLRRAQDSVRQILEKLMKIHAKHLQEQLITMRGNRYVLPVQDVYRTNLTGIVHDTSASGHTLFVEPLEVVEANNKIRELEAAEQEEINRILAVLTSEVVAMADTLNLNQNILAKLDFITAKARYAIKLEAHPPKLNTVGKIRLLNARHPLLPLKKAVPISLALGDKIKTLLITGPNTGGKTVALKTCGLLTLMAQSGLHIPASEQSEIAICQNITVDIGDAQSIENNLSTFSSHMRQLIYMTEQAGPGTLILSDEMGSGTDPLEGAALAQAILNTWREKGAITLATTHYRELKLYALSTEGVENACCELDPDTLQPTYRILMGAVGVSHAFTISARLGLDPQIIAKAKALLSEDEQNLENIMQDLTAAKIKAEAALASAARDSAAAAAAKREAETLSNQLRNRQRAIAAEEREKARDKYGEGLREIDRLIRELSDYLDEAERRSLLKRTAKLRSEAGANYHAIENEIGAETLAGIQADVDPAGRALQLKVGEQYYAPTLDLIGKLMTLPDNKGRCKLSSGTVQITVKAATLQDVSAAPTASTNMSLADKSEFYRHKQRNSAAFKDKSSPRPSDRSNGAGKTALPLELMLLGETTLDAIELLDRHIDNSVMAGVHEIRIVHGKGTGALRKAVQDFLRRDRRVKGFRLAGYGEGDSGVTIAELK